MAVATQAAIPAGNGTWDDDIVPALRKRLQGESAMLSKRMSGQSMSGDEGLAYNSHSRAPSINTAFNQRLQTHHPLMQSAAAINDAPAKAGSPHSRSPSIPRPSGIPRPSLTLYSSYSSESGHGRDNSSNNSQGTMQPYWATGTAPQTPANRARSRTISTPHPFDNEEFTSLTARREKDSSTLPTPASSRSNSPLAGLDRMNGFNKATNTSKGDLNSILGKSRIPRPSTSHQLQSYRYPSSNHVSRPSSNFYGDDYYTAFGFETQPPTTNIHTSTSVNGTHAAELLREPVPYQILTKHSTSNIDTPRESMESEERPFEHWYRGDVSRSGGVGELRMGKRKEMLDIANYGHRAEVVSTSRPTSFMSNNLQVGYGGVPITRKRAGSFGEAERGSVYIDDDAAGRAITEWVIDEMPHMDQDHDEDAYRYGEDQGYGSPSSAQEQDEDLTVRMSRQVGYVDDDRFEGRGQLPTPTEMHYPPHEDTDREPPSPDEIGIAHTMEGKPSLQPGRRPIQSPPPGPHPMLRSGHEHPNALAPGGAQMGRSFTAPLPLSVISQNRSSERLARPEPGSKPNSKPNSRPNSFSLNNKGSGNQQGKRSRTVSRPSQNKRPKEYQQVQSYNRRDEGDGQEAGPSNASDRPLSMLVDAIPSWSVPVAKDGNWDEVVPPAVAQKMGLDGYEKVHGVPQTPHNRKTQGSDIYSPAPGTFGYDHSKYRPPRSDDPNAHPDNMDDFGVPIPGTPPRSPTSSHPASPTPQSPRQRVSPSPAPFAAYQPERATEKHTDRKKEVEMRRLQQDRNRRPDDMQSVEQKEDNAGCCRCVVM